MREPRIPLPHGIRKRDSHLYGITGWISQPANEVECAAFGGYFRYDVKDELVVDGQLIDMWGSSSIEGEMTDDRLEFSKKYDQRKDVVNYRFKKQGGIWIGEYSGVGTEKGPAQCTTFLAEIDAFQIACGKPSARC